MYGVAACNHTRVVVRKPDGSDAIVARQYERLGGSTGPWAAEFHDLAWDGNSRLFVTAQQPALFLAAPQ